ncbi:hypothetical protein DH2020_044368 [Rehmannia glutinosa]|uniref:30S ribosomal protein S31, chloroplastic n=1 Tax=Rehmannia glutinosa TaxID=99300 RepID=A0ABR0UH55_REHGL
MASLLLGAPPMASQSFTISPSLSFSKSQTLIQAPLMLSPSASSLSTSSSTPTLPLIYCGRGDKKTARGKRFNHSFGNARPKDKKKGRGPPRVRRRFRQEKISTMTERLSKLKLTSLLRIERMFK